MNSNSHRHPRSSVRRLYRSACLAVLAIILTLSSPAPRLGAAAGPQDQPQANGLSPHAIAQINALIAEKMARTPAQRKMDSQLVYAAKMAAGQPIAAGVPTLQVVVPMTADNRAIVEVRATVTEDLLGRLRALGAEVTETSEVYHHVGLNVALDRIEAIASMPDVVFVGPKQEAMTNGFGGSIVSRPDAPAPTATTPGPSARRARKALDRAALIASVQHALEGQQGVITNVGSVTSEGDLTHRAGGASGARASFSVDGTGVKIGVLSDGVNSLAASQGRGDLGPVTVLSGQAGSGDEGTAMLEIIHDLAPGAQLYFATAFTSLTSFATNIKQLRAAGCDIIVDDVAYFVESAFQDGQAPGVTSTFDSGAIAQAVKDVTAGGALYFSSAGNSGRLNAGTSGTWEGDFLDGGTATAPLGGAGQLHNFGTAGSPVTFDTLTSAGFLNNLMWADPLGGSTNDYDLYLLSSDGTTLLSSGSNFQTGTQDPYEVVSNGSVGNRLVITKFAGADRFLHLGTNRGRLSIATAGEIHGHAAVNSANAYGVAATPACASFSGPNPGPCSSTFTSSNVAETFSSDGPRRIFFDSNGAAITPGNLTSSGGLVLNKPDITAADGVSTSIAGFNPFYGTSAAAPHAAAIAGLVKSRDLLQSATQVSTRLTSTVIDIHTAGYDRDSGLGIVMAFQAVAAVPPPTGTPPSITTNPAATTTVLQGQTVTFNSAASGSPTPTAQWQVSTNGGASWTNLPGATSASLSFNAQRPDNGKQYRVVYTNTSGTAASTAAALFVRLRVRADLDNDRKSDLMIWRPSNGYWFWLTSSTAYNVASAGNKQWGSSSFGDIPVSGDMDGDGIMDLVVWRASTGTWFWLTSSSGYVTINSKQWGNQDLGDVPMLADLDGDGKAELIVWRASTGTWFWLTSTSGYDYPSGLSKQWGNASLGDQPLLADEDGDGLADLTVWRASTGTFFWLTSSSAYAYGSQGNKQWGNASLGDIPMIADMDGDGVSDLIVWRASTSTYFWLTSQTGYNYAAQGQKQWGSQAQSDVPMLGDMDGDGIADLVVWRPGTGTWFWLTSSSGYSYASQANKQWGASGDVPMIK